MDFITKPFDLEELALRVRNALRWAGPSQTGVSVTSLPVDRETKERLHTLVSGGEWAVVFLRLVNFESIGRSSELPASDEALRIVVDTLNEIVTELGGERDFASHLDAADFVLVTAPERAEALRKEVAARLPYALQQFSMPQWEYPDGNEEEETPPLSVGIGVLSSADLSD